MNRYSGKKKYLFDTKSAEVISRKKKKNEFHEASPMMVWDAGGRGGAGGGCGGGGGGGEFRLERGRRGSDEYETGNEAEEDE